MSLSQDDDLQKFLEARKAHAGKAPNPPSDLDHLNAWERCIDKHSHHDTVGKCSWIIYRPDEDADSAMIRYSVRYPMVVQAIREGVRECEMSAGLIGADDDAERQLVDSMEFLLVRLRTAIQIFGEKRDGGSRHSDEAAEQGDSVNTTARSRVGRLKDGRIAKRNLRIKKLCEQRKLNGQWAKLAEVANADEEIQALNLDNSVTRDIARNAVQPPKKRRK